MGSATTPQPSPGGRRPAWVDILVAIATATSAVASLAAVVIASKAVGVANQAVFADVTPVLVAGSAPGRERMVVPVPIRAKSGTRYEKEEAKVRAIVTDSETYAVVFPLRNVGTGAAELADSAYLLRKCAEPATGGGTPTENKTGTPKRARDTVPVGETTQVTYYITKTKSRDFYDIVASGGNFCVDFRYTDLLQKQWASIRVNYRGAREGGGWEQVDAYHGEVDGP